jgi:heme/copper-type cytochrome/quinol oxidase subunit 3
MLCSLGGDIIREATYTHTITVQKGRLGMILFIVSEVMFFRFLGIFSF